MSRLKSTKPIVIFADATFSSHMEHYGLSSVLCKESVQAGDETDRTAYMNASLLLFASEWAARSAIQAYKVPEEKVRVVPFGANFKTVPSPHVLAEAALAKGVQECRLISVGVEWFRKGMDRAVDLATCLTSNGLPTTLTIVGCRPPAHVRLPPYVRIVDFVDKRSQEGERTLSELLLASHFHVLFSRSEAFGVAFSEANAHGLPNLAANVGGIPTAVRNGFGGYCFDVDVSMREVASFVKEHLGCPGWYQSASQRARAEYENRLNWGVIGKQIYKELRLLVRKADEQ